MSLILKHKNIEFGVGDTIKVTQKIKDGDKTRLQTFTGIVIKIKGIGLNKSFTLRRIGIQKVGIERIFPIDSPTINEVEIVRSGSKGIKRSKLYYIRDKHVREIENIYRRASKKIINKAKNLNNKKTSPSNRKLNLTEKHSRLSAKSNKSAE